MVRPNFHFSVSLSVSDASPTDEFICSLQKSSVPFNRITGIQQVKAEVTIRAETEGEVCAICVCVCVFTFLSHSLHDDDDDDDDAQDNPMETDDLHNDVQVKFKKMKDEVVARGCYLVLVALWHLNNPDPKAPLQHMPPIDVPEVEQKEQDTKKKKGIVAALTGDQQEIAFRVIVRKNGAACTLCGSLDQGSYFYTGCC